MEKEGLRYFGGYIAHKFPKYSFLSLKSELNNEGWIAKIARHDGKHTEPSNYFFKPLQEMETYFKLYNGEKSLKPGTDTVKTMTQVLAKYIKLSEEVIRMFVKCRMFFRMRILNKDIKSSRQTTKKMAKLKY